MQNKKFLLTTALPIALSVVAGILIIVINNSFILESKARSTVASEKKEFLSNIKELRAEKKQLTKEAEGYDAELKQNTMLIEEVEALKTTLDEYTADIEAANNTVLELDTAISEKQAYYDSLSELEDETVSDTKTLKSGDYKCPSSIKAGRYTAEGTGKIYFYTIANTLKDKADLSTIDTHSYSFEITSGESLKIDGSVTLKKIN